MLSKAMNRKIPSTLKRFFQIIEDEVKLGQYILYCNKRARKRMIRQQKLDFLNHRRQDVKKIIDKKGLQREFLIRKIAKYYNVSARMIQRDLAEIHY